MVSTDSYTETDTYTILIRKLVYIILKLDLLYLHNGTQHSLFLRNRSNRGLDNSNSSYLSQIFLDVNKLRLLPGIEKHRDDNPSHTGPGTEKVEPVQ